MFSGYLRHVRLSVLRLPSAWNNSVPSGRIFIKFDIYFQKSPQEIKRKCSIKRQNFQQFTAKSDIPQELQEKFKASLRIYVNIQSV